MQFVTLTISSDNHEVRHPGNRSEAEVIRDLLAAASSGAARSWRWWILHRCVLLWGSGMDPGSAHSLRSCSARDDEVVGVAANRKRYRWPKMW